MPTNSDFQKRLLGLVDETEQKRLDISKNGKIDYRSLSNALAYGIIPSTKTLIKLADYFNVSIPYLLARTNNNDFIKSNNPTTFQVRFELLCKENRFSHYKVSQDCYFDTSIITRWLNKNYLPTLEILDMLSSYFKVSLDYLLGRSDYKL